MKPLEGMLVLDFTQFTSGPLCSYLMADLGAEVVKIENPPYGDNNHYTSPSLNKNTSYITSLNHSKKCILMNMKDPRQTAVFWKMVKSADIVLDNFKAGTLEKFGVTWEKLQEVNPAIVWTSISGYGQTGVLAKRTAYDGTIHGVGGLMSVSGEKGGRPLKAGVSMADMNAGFMACCATLSAVYGARKTGKGRRIDLAMTDGTYAFIQMEVNHYLNTGEVLPRMGREHSYFAPYNSFACKDGRELMICTRNEIEFLSLCRVLGLIGIVGDPKYATNKARVANREDINRIVEEKTMEWDGEQLEKELVKAGVPCAFIKTIPEAMYSEQIQARNMLIPVSYDDGTATKIVGSPIKMSHMEEMKEAKSHFMGQDTIEFLSRFEDPALVHEIWDPVIADSKEKWAIKAARLK
ncbi:MAG: CoA transferase [Lachnospiraceae bacterium]|nr:CoA transferase [Lachnospiraceae bacterium]